MKMQVSHFSDGRDGESACGVNVTYGPVMVTRDADLVTCKRCLKKMEAIACGRQRLIDDETNKELESRADGHDTRHFESVENS